MARQTYGFQEETSPSYEFPETFREELWQSQFPDAEFDEPSMFITEGAEGGHKLFAAILNRAIRDYKQYLGRKDSKQFYLAKDAWLWINSDSDELTAFVGVCKLLDQDPDKVRLRIAELVEGEGIYPGALPVTHAS